MPAMPAGMSPPCQFRAFDRAGLTAEFAVPAHWEVTTMTAFGRPLADSPARRRRAVDDIQWMVLP